MALDCDRCYAVPCWMLLLLYWESVFAALCHTHFSLLCYVVMYWGAVLSLQYGGIRNSKFCDNVMVAFLLCCYMYCVCYNWLVDPVVSFCKMYESASQILHLVTCLLCIVEWTRSVLSNPVVWGFLFGHPDRIKQRWCNGLSRCDMLSQWLVA